MGFLAFARLYFRSEWFMHKFWISITFLIIISIPALVRSAHGADSQTWTDLTTIYEFSDRWRYDGDQGIRGLLSNYDFTLLYFRPSVRYQVKPWFTVHGGIRFFKTFSDDDYTASEIGPWQGLRFVGPKIGNYTISHYLRLEERMIWQTEGEGDFHFTLRARYQVGVRSPNFDILFKNGINLTTSLEFFWNPEESFTADFVNRTRLDFGVVTKISDVWSVKLHYIFQDGRAIEDNFFQDLFDAQEHILRLRLIYRYN